LRYVVHAENIGADSLAASTFVAAAVWGNLPSRAGESTPPALARHDFFTAAAAA